MEGKKKRKNELKLIITINNVLSKIIKINKMYYWYYKFVKAITILTYGKTKMMS